MTTLLLQPDEGTSWINTRLRNREHWVFIPLDSTGIDAVCHIEDLFYSGEASADFELAMLPAPDFGLLSLFFASKARLSTEDLAKELGQHPETLKICDIICLADNPERAGAVLAFLMTYYCADVES